MSASEMLLRVRDALVAAPCLLGLQRLFRGTRLLRYAPGLVGLFAVLAAGERPPSCPPPVSDAELERYALEKQLAAYELQPTGIPSCDAVLELWVTCAPKLEAWSGEHIATPSLVSGPQSSDERERESLSGQCGSTLGAYAKGWGPICGQPMKKAVR